jgi:hypothetical protein
VARFFGEAAGFCANLLVYGITDFCCALRPFHPREPKQLARAGDRVYLPGRAAKWRWLAA